MILRVSWSELPKESVTLSAIEYTPAPPSRIAVAITDVSLLICAGVQLYRGLTGGDDGILRRTRNCQGEWYGGRIAGGRQVRADRRQNLSHCLSGVKWGGKWNREVEQVEVSRVSSFDGRDGCDKGLHGKIINCRIRRFEFG